MCVGTVCNRMRAESLNRGQVLKPMSVTRAKDKAGSIYFAYCHSDNQTTNALIITMTEPENKHIHFKRYMEYQKTNMYITI